MFTVAYFRILPVFTLALATGISLMPACRAQAQPTAVSDPPQPASTVVVRSPHPWQSLLEGDGLHDWKSSEFGADGPVTCVNACIQLGVGEPLTGVTYAGPVELPTVNYELRLRARRVAGMDFFCGLTFPYLNSHCTLILGGWGGGLIGLSSLDGQDASENESTRYESFRRNHWYDVRLRVTDGSITAWIDQKQRVICNVAGRSVSTRPEVVRSRPLGIASYRTQAEIKQIALRRLNDSEIPPQPAPKNNTPVDTPSQSTSSPGDRSSDAGIAVRPGGT